MCADFRMIPHEDSLSQGFVAHISEDLSLIRSFESQAFFSLHPAIFTPTLQGVGVSNCSPDVC
jgi:hypothetical protein